MVEEIFHWDIEKNNVNFLCGSTNQHTRNFFDHLYWILCLTDAVCGVLVRFERLNHTNDCKRDATSWHLYF